MSVTINSRVASLKAQRQLSSSSEALERTYARLSSGSRINSASDDAAALAISSKLTSDTKLLGQASRNLSDGVSVLAVADGALEELTSVLSRLTELAAQSASGTLSSSQRKALDTEAQALSMEYNRVARTTIFNGRALLNGDFGQLGIAAGINGASSAVIQSGLGGGTGNGTFQPATSYAQASASLGTVSADFNGDGILDIATGTSANVVGVNLGNGDGSFRAARTFAVGNNVQALGVGDLNGDGVADLISADTGDAALSVLIGNGDGTFATRRTYASGNNVSAIKVVDINSDGVADLITADYDDDSVSIFLGSGGGTLNARSTYAAGNGTNAVTLGDYNNDGRLDFATVNALDDTMSVAMGNGNGTFGATLSIALAGGGSQIATADINQDGVSDLVTSSYVASNGVAVFFGGSGGLSSAVNTSTPVYLDFLAVEDFTGDGNLDLVASSYSTNSVQLLSGNGNGTFGAAVSIGAGGGTFNIVAEDFNGDGATDIATGNILGQSISVILGNRVDGVAALQTFSLKTRFDSLQALGQFNQALTRISQQRGTIGAFQSRLESAGRNVLSSAAAYSEANSRIRDADVASETADLLRLNILQQSGAAILGQANQQGALALRLLGD